MTHAAIASIMLAAVAIAEAPQQPGLDPAKPMFRFACTGKGAASRLSYDVYLKEPAIKAHNAVRIEVHGVSGVDAASYSFPHATLMPLPAPKDAPYQRVMIVQANNIMTANGPRFSSVTGVQFLQQKDAQGNNIKLWPLGARLKLGAVDKAVVHEFECQVVAK